MRTSDAYEQVREKARWSHEHGRSVFHLGADDVVLARLFAYACRAQTIGAFQACRAALAEVRPNAAPDPSLQRAECLIRQLEDLAVLPVPGDCRAVIWTFHHYDLWTGQAIEALEAAASVRVPGNGSKKTVERIKDRFVAHIERITNTNGIYAASDTLVPKQGNFPVPGLEASIAPLIYGDHHSWNFGDVPGRCVGRSSHRHLEGVEIHLGFSPIRGRTILGDRCSPLAEGYAMPIPSGVVHGFDNLTDEPHRVPFIFGSRTLGGWGVFYDVEPCHRDVADLNETPLESPAMGPGIHIEREIRRLSGVPATKRELLIPPSAPGAREPVPSSCGFRVWATKGSICRAPPIASYRCRPDRRRFASAPPLRSLGRTTTWVFPQTWRPASRGGILSRSSSWKPRSCRVFGERATMS